MDVETELSRANGAAPLFAHNVAPTVSITPKKQRSHSDSTPSLDPSPRFKEEGTGKARDDDILIATPSRTPRRVDLSARGLYLQMPPRDTQSSSSAAGTGLGIQSPQLDQREVYGSPSSVLPRHSRGMDFARAATNLHHSTLAEQQSPDSSPTITQRQMPPPSSRRGSSYAMAIDSPRIGSISAWSWSSVGSSDKAPTSRSVVSTNAMTSEASSSSSDDDDTLMGQDEAEDAILSTPNANKMNGGHDVTPYETHRWSTESAISSNNQSPVSGAFAKYRRNMFGKRHTKNLRDHPYQRHRTSSPEPSAVNTSFQPTSNLFAQESAMRRPPSRRESLSLGIGTALHITSSNEDAEEAQLTRSSAVPGVVRRPVTRRSNLLPKTKNFARIRAALQEESSPLDTDVRRESEVVRQVRVNDVGLKEWTSTTPSSPDITPNVKNLSNEGSEMSDLEASAVKGGLGSGSLPDLKKTSISRDLLQNAHNRSQTPPPPLHAFPNRHRSSSGMSEDINLDSLGVSTPPSSISMTSSHTADAKPSIEPAFIAPFQPPTTLPSAAEMSRKVNKRRRDDDFDVNSFKRRAVSPGLSVHSSPVLGQSPVSNTGCWTNKPSREGSIPASTGEERSQSIGSSSIGGGGGQSTPVLGPKRVGLQGMTDTSDGMMNMSID